MVAELCQKVLGILKVRYRLPGVVRVRVTLPFHEVLLTSLL